MRQRQDEAAEHLKGMISELEAVAAALRRTVRENTKRKAQHLLNGEEAPPEDTSAAARLAVIPEEISALKALAEQRSMTNEERQEWESIVSELQDAATAISSAISARSAAYGKVRVYMFDTQYWATGAARINLETYITEATALNTYSQEEDNEE